MPTTSHRPAARLLPLALALLATACAVGSGEANRSGGWTGDLSLTIERENHISESSRQLDEIAVSRGAIPSLRLVPTDPDEPSDWRAELDGLSVSCTHDSVSVSRDTRGEVKIVSKGEVSGPATAEVALRLEREDGVYHLSVDFFGPPLPIRIEHFRNGVSESVQIVDYQECSFRHDVTRPLPSPLEVLTGNDTGDDPPWRHGMEWRLEPAR